MALGAEAPAEEVVVVEEAEKEEGAPFAVAGEAREAALPEGCTGPRSASNDSSSAILAAFEEGAVVEVGAAARVAGEGATATEGRGG